ncbi:hypothetical protein KGA66_28520, partial [Actinocrinis puniceicyclus]|nr:hypothetical protein [Actinocrinis puniceicyclus]
MSAMPRSLPGSATRDLPRRRRARRRAAVFGLILAGLLSLPSAAQALTVPLAGAPVSAASAPQPVPAPAVEPAPGPVPSPAPA